MKGSKKQKHQVSFPTPDLLKDNALYLNKKLVLERTMKRKQEELKQKQRLVQTKLNFSKANEN